MAVPRSGSNVPNATTIRYEALAKSFLGAASCDFKVFDLNGNHRHDMYDIRHCFEIG